MASQISPDNGALPTPRGSAVGEASRRFASWRPSASLPMASRGNGNTVAMAWTGIVLLLVAVGATLAGNGMGAGLSVLVSLGLLVGSRKSQPIAIATADDVDLLEEGTDAWLTEFEIVQNGIVTGRDRGTIFFERGVLGFNGHRTSFLVTRRDLATIVQILPDPERWYEIRLIPRDHPYWSERDVRARFRVLRFPSTAYTVREDRFRGQLEHFQCQDPSEVGQFPPMELGPFRDTGEHFRALASLFYAAPTFLLAVLAASLFGGQPSLVLAVLAFGAPTAYFFWSVGRDNGELASRLHRLEREDSMAMKELDAN